MEAKCLRTLRESADFKELFSNGLFGTKLEEIEKDHLNNVRNHDEEAEAGTKSQIRFINTLKTFFDNIELDGIQAATYLETYRNGVKNADQQ